MKAQAMGKENNEYIYDLRRIEDVFACLEILGFAQGALYGVDPNLAQRMEKVIAAMGAFSELVAEGGLQEAPRQTPQPAASSEPDLLSTEVSDAISDLTGGVVSPHQKGSADTSAAAEKESPVDTDEEIVDILTGEKVK